MLYCSMFYVLCSMFYDGPLEDNTGEVLMRNTEMAEALNQYFASVFKVENNEDFPKTVVNAEQLGAITITREKVFNKLMGLKADKSLGPDGLHPRVLKELAAKIVNVLVVMSQNSLDADKIAVDWK